VSIAHQRSRELCLAVDIGGTKIEAALVLGDGTITTRERISTKDHQEDLFAALEQLLHRVRGSESPGAVGVGCGGPMRAHGLSVSPLNIPAWREFALLDSLREATGLTVFIDNDAKALALGEGLFGAARGLDNYVSMVVSTGVGGGVVLDGRLLDGCDGNAGHIGHVLVVPDGRVCACGARGCLEAETSGVAIETMTGAPAAQAPLELRRRTGYLVGRAVSSAAALLDFNRCFVAGSVALGFGAPFFDAANEAVREHARIEHARGLRIEPSQLGFDGPLLGAAAVAWRALES
jgi:glucokinase